MVVKRSLLETSKIIENMIRFLKIVYMGIAPMLCAAIWIILYKIGKLNDGGNVFLMLFLTFLCLFIAWAVSFIFKPEGK